jgi:hypothetical protein
MTTKTAILALLLTGFVASAPVLWWGLADLKHIPGGVWRHSAQRPRRMWRAGMISSYALGGWPVIVAVWSWRHSTERANLLDEWKHLSERKRRSRQRAREAAEQRKAEARSGAADVPDPVVVLSDYEDT